VAIDPKLQKAVAKSCPALQRAMPKHVLPKSRQGDYPNLDLADSIEIDRLIKYGLGTFDHRAETSFLSYLTTIRRIECGATIFLNRELIEPLLHSNFGDLHFTDLRWRLPGLRFVVPAGALSVPRANEITTFTVARIESDDIFGCPVEIAQEVDRLISKIWRRPNLHRLERFSYQFNKNGGFILSETSDQFEVFARVVKTTNDLPGSSNDSERILLVQLERLAWHTLVFLSLAPFVEYEPAHIERKAHFEGSRLIPALHRARFLSEFYARAIRHRAASPKEANIAVVPSETTTRETQGDPTTGHQLPAMWRAGHRKKQVCGPGRAERKSVWIAPYKTHGPSTCDPVK
jgi:hypothetical protein